MKLPCYLVRDLLPLFKDNVCDPQTSADVQEHLDDCAECRAILNEMDVPELETAAEEEKDAASAAALNTVKKDLGRQKKKIALTVTAVLIALFGVFFGWRYWMMHSYVDLAHVDLEIVEDRGPRYFQKDTVAFQNYYTKIYYGSEGYVVKYYKNTPIAFLSVTQTRWEVLMRQLFKEKNEPIYITLPGTNVITVTHDTYLKLCETESRQIDEFPWDDCITAIRMRGDAYERILEFISEAAEKNRSME
mgnify:CR=1 FL=1